MDRDYIACAAVCIAAAVVSILLMYLRISRNEILSIPPFATRAADAADKALISLYEDSAEAGMVRALVLGRKDMVPWEVTSDYRKSGASHLLALSGLHLGTVYGILRMVFAARSRGWITARGIFGILAMGFYSLMTGMSDSTARAYIMICIYEMGNISGRKQKPLRVLGASAAVILCFNPEAFMNVGFQLSYCAMLGIFIIYPHLRLLVYAKTRAMKYVWNTLALSVACQAATLPAVMWYFGYFPKYFLVTNLLSIPLMSVALPLLILSVILWFVWPEGARAVAEAAVIPIRLMNGINGTIASLP